MYNIFNKMKNILLFYIPAKLDQINYTSTTIFNTTIPVPYIWLINMLTLYFSRF